MKVFLSYVRKDVERARSIAQTIEQAGHSVWWDRHIKGGAQYSKEIEHALNQADAIVVLWSEQSVDSAWVRDEAAAGRDTGRLVPVRLDTSQPPLGFRQYQTVDLGKKTRSHRYRDELLQAIDNLAPAVAAPADSRSVETPKKKRERSPNRWLLLTCGALILLAVTSAAVWHFFAKTSSIPVVAVAPAEGSAQADSLARDLLVKLGSLRSARTDAVRLTAAAAGKSPIAEFVFETSGNNDSQNSQANLELLAGNDRAVLWWKDFETKDGRQALEQSMAYTAGQVLDCALQANAPGQPRLDEDTFKLFLNGCALFGDRYVSDAKSLVPIFEQVVAKAPRLEPAWSRLLFAEAQNIRTQRLFSDHWSPASFRTICGRAARSIRAFRHFSWLKVV